MGVLVALAGRSLTRTTVEPSTRLLGGSANEIAAGMRTALPMVMLTILVVLLILALLGGGFGYGRYGAAGLSPAAIVGVILVIMLLTGGL